MIFAGDQEAGFVLFMSVGVPGETPAIFVSEVANPAKVGGSITEPVDPLIARLAGRRSTSARHVRFGVHVDVAESAAEAHVDSSELSGKVFGSVIENPPLCTYFDAERDALPAGMGGCKPKYAY